MTVNEVVRQQFEVDNINRRAAYAGEVVKGVNLRSCDLGWLELVNVFQEALTINSFCFIMDRQMVYFYLDLYHPPMPPRPPQPSHPPA